MDDKELTEIGRDLAVSFDSEMDAVILWYTGGYSPRRLYVLEYGEMELLLEWWHDGYCAVCNGGIPQGTRVCCQCLDAEVGYHNNTHLHEFQFERKG